MQPLISSTARVELVRPDVSIRVADGLGLGLQHLSGHLAAHGAHLPDRGRHRLELLEQAVELVDTRAEWRRRTAPPAGLGWTSMKKPSTPAAAAARARIGVELARPAGGVAEPPGELQRVGAIKDHRREATHDRQPAHVDHQVVVAERSSRAR